MDGLNGFSFRSEINYGFFVHSNNGHNNYTNWFSLFAGADEIESTIFEWLFISAIVGSLPVVKRKTNEM